MLHLTEFPNNPISRVYCTLAIANVMMDAFCKTPPPIEVVWSGSVSRQIVKKSTLTLKGRDADEVRHLWSALMHLGITAKRPFDETTLLVPESVQFKPKGEFGFLGKWRDDSLYKQLYAKMTNVTYQPQESEFPFGYHIPMTAEMAHVRNEVVRTLCNSVLDTYFVVDRNEMSFKRNASPDLFYKFGAAKIGQAFATIGGHVTSFDFSNKKLNTLQIESLVKIIKSLPITIKKLDLSHNNLHQLGVEGLSYFIANLPPQIASIKLKNNGLSNFKRAELLRIFDNLSIDRDVIDVNDNGLDYTIVQEITENIKAKRAKAARVLNSTLRPAESSVTRGETSVAGNQRFFAAGNNAPMPEPSAPPLAYAQDEPPPPYSLY